MALIDHLPLKLAFGMQRVPAYPQAQVKLDEIERTLNIYLHALMRSCEQKLVAAEKKLSLPQSLSSRRHLNSLVWQESGTAHLPEVIHRFDDPGLNRDLYFWLAAYIAFDQPLPPPESNQPLLSDALGHLLQGVITSARVLKACPGLHERYQRLCAACLSERDFIVTPLVEHRKHAAVMLEASIRRALGDRNAKVSPWLGHAIDAAEVGVVLPNPPAELLKVSLPFWPVAMWGRPVQVSPASVKLIEELIDDDLLERTPASPEEPEQADASDYLEETDEEEGDQLSGSYLYPEWNYKTDQYRDNWCQVIEELQQREDWAEPPVELKKLSRRVRRQFEALRIDDRWLRRLTDGEEVDLDDFIEAVCERRGCGYASERLYRHRKRDDRELAVMVLLDVSNSTQFQVGDCRVIDVERQAMLVMAEALSEVGDVFSIYAFSGYGRTQVDCLRLKDFDENYDDSVRERIFSLTPRGSTRIGAALRHMGKCFMRRSERHRLLLLLTDGRPFDPADNYKGLYALEDTRKALQELHNSGIYAYGLTIDRSGLEYLPYLFGPGKYTVFSNVLALPEFLPKLYAKLTGLGK
ncbi:VWA domain-containing protein [Kaarinaea lacus]